MKDILKELKHHTPFTALATAVAVFIVIFLQYFLKLSIPEDAFHFFHFLHIVASAMVTSAIFYKYKPSLISAALVGVVGAIVIGSISDVVFPYLAWVSLDLHVHFHLPLIEETASVLFLAFLGSGIGVATKMSKFPHFAHVFLSVFASLFYLFTFASVFSLGYFAIAFFAVFVAVIIPCCLSDIIFPFLFIRKK